jgi:hypothetical protein
LGFGAKPQRILFKMKVFEGCQIKNWGKYTAVEGGHPVVRDRDSVCMTVRPAIARQPSVPCWPSVTRRFSAGLTDNVRPEGKGVNALTEFLAWVNSPVVNDRGTERATPDRPHQKERTWSSVTRRPSVTRRFSAGHKEGNQSEGKGVNALTVCTAADGGHPVVNDRGTEYAAAGGGNPVANDLGTEHTAVCGGDLDYHTPSHFGNMLDLRTPTLQRRD